jgi:hypothetical protein
VLNELNWRESLVDGFVRLALARACWEVVQAPTQISPAATLTLHVRKRGFIVIIYKANRFCGK